MKKIFTAGMLLASFAAVSLAHGTAKKNHLILKPTSPLVSSATVFFERKGFNTISLKSSISYAVPGLTKVNSQSSKVLAENLVYITVNGAMEAICALPFIRVGNFEVAVRFVDDSSITNGNGLMHESQEVFDKENLKNTFLNQGNKPEIIKLPGMDLVLKCPVSIKV